MRKHRAEEQSHQFCPLFHDPCGHIICQNFLVSSPHLMLSLASVKVTTPTFVLSSFSISFLFTFISQPVSHISSIIQNYISTSFIWWEREKPLRETWDWAVKLEFQAGINLAGYVHINMLIIFSVEGHAGCVTPVTFKRTQYKAHVLSLGNM